MGRASKSCDICNHPTEINATIEAAAKTAEREIVAGYRHKFTYRKVLRMSLQKLTKYNFMW